jgi:uncharacterized protein DUF3891
MTRSFCPRRGSTITRREDTTNVIIRIDGGSRLFITQPDHAALAAEVMRHWRAQGLDAHPRRGAILDAIRDHDNGWIEEDAATHVAADGEPLDFIAVPASVKHRIWPRAVERIGATRPYEAALIAQHALTVHGPQPEHPAWRKFFAAMTSIRANQLARVQPPLTRGRFLADYRFVRIGDLLSLMFCNGWQEPRDLPHGGRTILKGATLEIHPDPFAGARIPLRIRARRLPIRRYRSPEELRAALDAATLEAIEGHATGA